MIKSEPDDNGSKGNCYLHSNEQDLLSEKRSTLATGISSCINLVQRDLTWKLIWLEREPFVNSKYVKEKKKISGGGNYSLYKIN